MAKGENGFEKDKKRASEAGKKTKRGVSLKRTLKEFLQKQADENGKLSPENIIQAMTLHGMKGNSAMLKLMFEYIDGRVPNDLNITGIDIPPAQIIIDGKVISD